MKVIGSVVAPLPEVEFDDFVFLDVAWAPPVGGLLYRFASESGVVIAEAYVDEASGVLYSIAVLNLPQTEGDGSLLECEQVEQGLPIVDRVAWDLNADNRPQKRFVEDRSFRSLVRGADGVFVQLEDRPVVCWLKANPLAFGLSEECEVVALRLPAPDAR